MTFTAHLSRFRPEQTWDIEVRRSYWQVFYAIPQRTRHIFLMHLLRRMIYNEIAQQLGITNHGVE
ncbi:MAG: hypothetical protein ACKVOS_03975 [Sphingorhabdus sp.]